MAAEAAYAGSTSDIGSYADVSYQDYVDYMQWKGDLDGIGLFNVHAEVNLLNPTRKTYHDAMSTGTGTKKKLPTSRSHVTLGWQKLYLDSCATYHSAFLNWYLDNIHKVDIFLKGNCNTGVTTGNQKCWFGAFEMWDVAEQAGDCEFTFYRLA